MYYNAKGEPCGLIYNTQGYTIHDGPGIRTELFFKGCPLSCPWCSNPEGIDPRPQLGIYPSKCLSLDKCGWCLKACPMTPSPLRHDERGVILSAEMAAECYNCLKCAEDCPSGAIMVWGKLMTVPEVMKLLERDRSFYNRSGGGVTVSGGEVMVQWEFVSMLLRACREADIHVCVESALHCPTEHMLSVLENADMLITDIKYFDSARHKDAVGQGNELILKNIVRACGLGLPVVIRTPLIPGWNDDEENLRAIAGFIKELGSAVICWQLLPYRKMGTEKYASLNQPYPMGDYVAPERSEWEPALLAKRDMIAGEFGLPVVAGAAEKLPGY